MVLRSRRPIKVGIDTGKEHANGLHKYKSVQACRHVFWGRHTIAAIAWPAVRPIPIKLLPIVQEDKQTPQVPIKVNKSGPQWYYR